MNHLADFFIKLLADWLLVPIVLAGIWAMVRLPLGQTSRYQVYARALMVGLTALTIAKVSSLFYHGERPFIATGHMAKASFLQNGGFPSDHAVFAFTITLVVWASTKNVKVSMALLILSVLVAIGRVLALVHTPADVLGGAACAAVAGLVWYGRSLFDFRRTRGETSDG